MCFCVCMGCTMCVHGHTSVRMGRHVGCVCRPGRTGYPCLFILNAISVSGLSPLLTKLRPGAFAFLVPELFRAFLDMINEIPQNQEPKRILPSLSYPMRKIAKYLVWHYTQTNLRAGYFAAVFLLLSPLWDHPREQHFCWGKWVLLQFLLPHSFLLPPTSNPPDSRPWQS